MIIRVPHWYNIIFTTNEHLTAKINIIIILVIENLKQNKSLYISSLYELKIYSKIYY